MLKRPGWAGKALLAAFSALLAFFPFARLSFSDYLLSLCPSCSIGSVVLFIVILWRDLGGRQMLVKRDLLFFSLWNVVLSLFLFASALGFVGPDLYALGYDFSVVFTVMGLLTVFLALLGSPLALIFIAYIAAFDLGLLPSPNFFDYMTDGLLFIISTGIVLYYVSWASGKILKASLRRYPNENRIGGLK